MSRAPDWEEAELTLRHWLDDDEAVSVLQVLQAAGWQSPSEVTELRGLVARQHQRVFDLYEALERISPHHRADADGFDDGQFWCGSCDSEWPCPTAKVLLELGEREP